MDDAAGVGKGHGVGSLHQDLQVLLQALAVDDAVPGRALDVFHRVEQRSRLVLRHVVNGDNVGVFQVAGDDRLGKELLPRLGFARLGRIDALECHGAVDRSLSRRHDHPHSASPQLLDQFVVGRHRAGTQAYWVPRGIAQHARLDDEMGLVFNLLGVSLERRSRRGRLVAFPRPGPRNPLGDLGGQIPADHGRGKAMRLGLGEHGAGSGERGARHLTPRSLLPAPSLCSNHCGRNLPLVGRFLFIPGRQCGLAWRAGRLGHGKAGSNHRGRNLPLVGRFLFIPGRQCGLAWRAGRLGHGKAGSNHRSRNLPLVGRFLFIPGRQCGLAWRAGRLGHGKAGSNHRSRNLPLVGRFLFALRRRCGLARRTGGADGTSRCWHDAH